MILNIYGNVPDNESLYVKVNNEIKILNNLNTHISFDIEEKREYEISIEDLADENEVNKPYIFIFILTSIIQGILNILLMNAESDWYMNIKPYCIKGKMYINLDADIDLHMRYKKSRYDKNQVLRLPTLTVEPDMDLKLCLFKNIYSFSNQYFGYVKKLISLDICCYILFGIILYGAVVSDNIAAIALCVFVMASLAFIAAIVIYKEYKRMKKLQGTSEQENAIT